jgi:hypothetical protein
MHGNRDAIVDAPADGPAARISEAPDQNQPDF